jgi:hypothetical protein
MTPPQVWVVALRSLGQMAGPWRSRGRSLDGSSRALGGAGCFARPKLARVLHGLRQALAPWGAPEAGVRDQGAVLLAFAPCLRPRARPWSPSTPEPPWPKRAASGLAIQRRLRAASVVGGPAREPGEAPQAPWVPDAPLGGPWAHQPQDAPGRVSSLSPEGLLGHATGRAIAPRRLRWALRLRPRTRPVRPDGPRRLHHFGRSVAQGVWGQRVAVWVSDAMIRREQAEQVGGRHRVSRIRDRNGAQRVPRQDAHQTGQSR